MVSDLLGLPKTKEISTMAQICDPTIASPGLSTLIDHDNVSEAARALGVVLRDRKVDVFILVWTLVLGFAEAKKRTLDGLRVVYKRLAKHDLARSAFHDRLTPALASLLRTLAMDGVALLGSVTQTMPARLSGFRDLLAIDATVLRLHDWLSKNYAACRTNHTKAAAKLHMVMSVIDGSPNRMKLTAERVNDKTPWKRVGQWVRGCLLLFDLGYYSFHLFDRIDANDGFFLSRAKSNANPVIVSENQRWRGRAVSVVGQRLQDVLPRLQRQYLDVNVEVEFDRRVYRGVKSKKKRTFRLVAVRNDETRSYHCYFTNIPPEELPASDISETYALRWQVEILFKAMKSHGHLDQLPSRKKAIVECLVWASILATLASQVLQRLVRQAVDRDRHIPLLRWAALFERFAWDVLVAAVTNSEVLGEDWFSIMIQEAPDPNRNRKDAALARMRAQEAA